MKKILLFTVILSWMVSSVSGQSLDQDINRRIRPPLQPNEITQELAALEVELAKANAEVDFWRNAHFYNDPKRERERKEKLVYWAQKTVEIRNQMTKLKLDRSFYMHNRYGNQKYYYKR